MNGAAREPVVARPEGPTRPGPAAPAAIEVEGLGRTFDPPRRRRGAEPVVALAGVSLSIRPGELHGLLGPNGAGKTTLVKILSTVLLPTSGRAGVLGFDVVREAAAVRRRIGIVLGGDQGLYGRLTGRQNLRYWAALYRLPGREGRARTEALLERLGLSGRAEHRVETYSRGMRQRLHLARGLIGDPRVLFLDEPTTGMDPIAAREFRALLGELVGEGRTILLTTHDMAEAESVCDRVTLIDRGRVVATESPQTLATWISRFERVHAEDVEEAVLAAVRTMAGVTAVSGDRRAVRIETDSRAATAEVLRFLVQSGVTSIRTAPPSLEEVYVRLIGERGMGL